MSQTETEPSESLVDADRGDVAADLDDVHEQAVRGEDRIVILERDLGRATDQEAAKGHEFDIEHARRVAIELELQAVRVEEARLLLEEASQTSDAMLAEAEQQAQKITEETDRHVEQMLTDARAEGAAIVDAGRAKLETLEAEASRRAAQLDSENQRLERRLSAMQKRHDELRETLQLVADIAIEELSEAQRSVERLHSGPNRRTPNASAAPDTSSAAPITGSVTDL